MLTLGQAAKATGKSKTAIANAIKEGRISAERLEGGQYRIDPSELFRVYQPANRQQDSSGVQTVTPQNAVGLRGETELLRELVAQIKEERDDLRRRLDNSEAARQKEAEAREQAAIELRRLTLMITDQRPPAHQTTVSESQGKGRLWEKLFSKW